ncbi:MAG TPA: LuxR C-terminal-related transcriptional regulator, partial [Actinomycetes bacterium]|nr:LuxR C-terminal-related transcriptional regulator [Actinomycetes bacterium]
AAAEQADGAQRVWALAELGNTRFRLNDLAGVGEIADRLAEAADPDDPGQRALAAFARGVTLTVAGDPAAGRPLLIEVLELLQSPALRHDPRYLVNLALAAGFFGDIRGLVAPLEQRLAEIRERGALGLLVPGLALMAAGRAWLGDHTGAFADAGEAAELGEQLGYASDAAVAVEMLAWQSAARGLHDDARRALERARALTDRAGTTSFAAHQAITAAFCALCRGDLAQTATLLEARIATDGGVGSMGEPLGVAPDLVEAYIGLGRAGDAAALTERYADATAPSPPSPTAALVARCQGLTAAAEDAAAEAFQTALAAHAQAPDAFETARTRLLYGARLRRAGQRVAAREQLRVALDAFTAMDLTAWAQRAANELAATGATARPRRPLPEEPLTSQETRVALLVARGLSNREVAAALFLSPKTIEHHLASVFRKRGYRSRTELASAFAAAAATG